MVVVVVLEVVLLEVVVGAMVVGVPLCAMVTSSSRAVVVTSSTARVGTDLGGNSIMSSVFHNRALDISCNTLLH